MQRPEEEDPDRGDRTHLLGSSADRGLRHNRAGPMSDLGKRIEGLDWPRLKGSLDERGYALTPSILRARECNELARLFDDDERFRSVIDMRRHRFGSGVYKYFDRPLPEPVQEVRERFYRPLARLANRWAKRLGSGERFPDTLGAFLEICHGRGQRRPTPLIFRYEEGDFNALHQDVYGEVGFPFQVLTVLGRPGRDFTGGEFLLVTQLPRAQSVGEAINLGRGEMLIFPNRQRPVEGKRGDYRVNVRHGVSRVRSGTRHTLGIIFHDSEWTPGGVSRRPAANRGDRPETGLRLRPRADSLRHWTAVQKVSGGWNHNTLYHRVILESVPPGCRRALDVGCGEGTLTRELRRVVPVVVGIDSDDASIAAAQAHPGAGDICYVEGDVLSFPFEPRSFDLVACVASLHHMDAAAGLRRLSGLLRPGGALAVIGLARSSPSDLLIDAAAIVPNRLRRRLAPYWQHPSPTAWPPPESYASMRRIAARLLPGARLKRRLYWRYTLVWAKP